LTEVTELLTREENLVGPMAVNREVIGRAETFDRSDRVVLDMDSSESPVHGQQEGSAYNGHFETVVRIPFEIHPVPVYRSRPFKRFDGRLMAIRAGTTNRRGTRAEF
jgi:hypothetical protein